MLLGIKLAVGILILDAAIKMIKKMQKKPIPRTIMISATVIMLLINIFSLKFSSVALMLIFGIISLVIFIVKGNGRKAGKQA